MKTFNVLLEEVSQKQLNDLETFADRILNKFDVDVEFTKHFADRMNDARNKPAITITELEKLFKKMADNKGKKIKKYGNKEAILKDMQSDLNLPIVVNWKNGEFEVVHKTIMRKKNFKSPDPEVKYESVARQTEKMKDDPCWKDYEMVGTKTKGGKQVPNCVPKESAVIDEKSVSVAQQKIMGMALAYKRGEMPDASDEVKKIAKSMTTKELEDFAKTKHKGLPMSKETNMPSESTAEYGKSQAAIARKKQQAAMKPGEMDKLKRLKDMMKNANKKESADLDEEKELGVGDRMKLKNKGTGAGSNQKIVKIDMIKGKKRYELANGQYVYNGVVEAVSKYTSFSTQNKNRKPSLGQSKLSSAEYQKAKKLKGFNADDWEWNGDLYIRVAEDVEESVDEKTAKDWSAEHARATERAYKKANKKKDAAKAKSASMKKESVELDEAMGKLNAKGEIEMTAKNFAKVHKDYKTKMQGVPYAMQIDPKTGGSALFPVKIIKESVELDEAVPGDGKFQKQWRQGAKEVKKGNITLVRGARGAHKVMKGGKQIDDFSFDSESDDFEIGRPGAMGKKRYADSVDDIFKMFESTGAKSLFSLLEELKEGKKPVSQMTPAEKEADAKKRKEYKAYQKSKRNEELEEATAELYFDTYTAAVQHAKAQAEKKGFEVVEDDWFQKVSVGQGKPKEGKTTSHLLKLTKDGKPVRKGLAIQVYNRGAGKKPYELNFYVS